MASPAFKKRDTVTYGPVGCAVRGYVDIVHRDGSVTVKAMFHVDANGKDLPGYLGFRYRVWPGDPQVGLKRRDTAQVSA